LWVESLIVEVVLDVNGERYDLDVPATRRLADVLRDDLGLTGTKIGCAEGACGACAVLVDGKEARSCVTPVASVADQEITTLEGLPARWAKQKGLSSEEAKATLHPVQQAWIEEQTPQCGFCQNGMMIKATELLEHNASPTVAQIKEAFTSGVSPHLCRCGSYTAIIEAVQRASSEITKRSKA